MKYLCAGYLGGSWPLLTNVKSDKESLPWLAIWTRVIDRPQQPSQSSRAQPVHLPHFRRAELQRLLRSH